MSSDFFERVFDRINKIDSASLRKQLKRLSGELAMMETVFRSIQEGILVVSRSGKLVYANGAAENLLAFNFEKRKGKHVAEFFGDVDWLPTSDAGWGANAGRGGEGGWSRLLTREIETTYPEHRILSLYAVPMPDANESGSSNALIILRDITREREQEVTALQDERLDAVKTLAASVAHEIGNPLNAISIHLQLLSREMRGLDDDRRARMEGFVETARSEVRRLDAIISQFLQALRHAKPNLEPGDIVKLIGETLDTLRPEIENRRIEVKVTGLEGVPPVLIDAGQIKQVFYNLIKNAMEAMPDGGALSVDLSADDAFLRLDFTDSGMGIAPESLGRIFEPYHTTKAKGTGLGLMIVQRIVQEHGGQIEVSSKEGSGTRFRIMLPLAQKRIRKITSDGAPPRN